MLALSDPVWLQGEFINLLGMLYWVGLRKNFGKMVGMVFCPCQAQGTQSETEYKQQMTGAGPSYRLRERV